MLGGKPQPAAGFAIGVERLLLLWSGLRSTEPVPTMYVVSVGEGAQRRSAAERLRAAETLREPGSRCTLHCGGGSFKSFVKKADASGRRWRS